MWEPLEIALQQVRLNSEHLMRIKGKRLSDYLPLEMNSFPYYVLPALVLIGTLWGGGKDERIRKLAVRASFSPRALGLASIFQLVYLAAEVHDRVDELREKITIKGESGPYFSVLAGDYLYGRLLQRLCEIECSDRVVPLAQVICAMNDAGIKRKELRQAGQTGEALMQEVLEKEFGALFAEAGKTGAWLSGGSASEEEMIGQIGWCLGLAVGVGERGFNPIWKEIYCQRAEKMLAGFPEGEVKQLLRELVHKVQNTTWGEKEEIVKWPSVI